MKLSGVARAGDLDIQTTECMAYSAVTSGTEHEMPTVSCVAYNQSQQVPRIQDVTYEVISGEIEQSPAHTQRPTESDYETIL